MRYLLLILICSSLTAYSQPVETIIKQQAVQMGTALYKGDSKTFSRYIPAEVLQNPDDAKFIFQMIDSGFTMFKTFGGEIKNIRFGQPSEIVKDGKKWQSALLQTTTIVSPFADAELQSVLLAQSIDEGKNWTFIDLSFRKIKELKDKMPQVNAKLQIPKASPPKITMKEQRQ